MHYTYDKLDWIPLGNRWERATVTLDKGDTAANPGKPDRALCGPAVVTYDRHPTQVIVNVEDLP